MKAHSTVSECVHCVRVLYGDVFDRFFLQVKKCLLNLFQ